MPSCFVQMTLYNVLGNICSMSLCMAPGLKFIDFMETSFDLAYDPSTKGFQFLLNGNGYIENPSQIFWEMAW